MSAMTGTLPNEKGISAFIRSIAFWSIALVLVIATRGRLGFRASER